MASSKDNKTCFVIMPFTDGEGYEKGHFKRVFEDVIEPAVKKCGYEPQRADQVQQTNLIHIDILHKLLDAPICICDLSTRNPNVLFELGIRQAFDKPVVLVQEKGTPKIFDIAMLRILEYSKDMKYRDVLEIQQQLADAINATIEAEKDSANVNSIVKLLSINPAIIPHLDKENKEDLTIDLLSSQVADVRRMLEMVLSDPKRLSHIRSVATIEFERISRKIEELKEQKNKGKLSNENFFRALDVLREDVYNLRRISSNPQEMEYFMFLDERINRLMSRI